MKNKILTASIFLIISLHANAQTQFKIAERFYSGLSDSLTNQIIHSLDKLLLSIDNNNPDTTLIDTEDADLNRYFFYYLKGIEEKDTIQKYFQGQLINLYPIENNQYIFTIAYLKNDEIGHIQTFLAKENNGSIVFANPIKYNTKHWKKTTIGTLTYYYPDTVDMERARLFDRKNNIIAQKLNLPVRKWDVYLCPNYQEVIQIQGCYYNYLQNGKFNSGYIMDPKTLFSCMNDEDFSHDILHIYASQIRGKERNAVTECGLAYYWGNAYHSGNTYHPGVSDKAPGLEELLPALRQYLQSHEDAKLVDLFEKSPNVLAEYGYPWPINVNRIIAAVICREIENQKGTDGIIKILKCGRGYDNLYKATDKLIGINRENFNEEVYKLIYAAN